MKCPFCGTDNRTAAKFCRACGGHLPADVTPSGVSHRPKVFLTHAWDDIAFARRLHDDLKARGFPLWFDDRTLKPGHRLAQEISQGLEWCDIYIPVISQQALKSKWCWEEINAAITLSNRTGRGDRPHIISVLAEDCEKQLPALLASRMYINFAGRYDVAMRELIEKGFRPSGATLSAPDVDITPLLPLPERIKPRATPPPKPPSKPLRRNWLALMLIALVICVILRYLGIVRIW